MSQDRSTQKDSEEKSNPHSLAQAIEKLEHLSDRSFGLFAFANEMEFSDSLQKIGNTNPIKTDKIRAALLVGESNILSCLPELASHTDVIICNDINAQVRAHTKFMLECLSKSDSPEEFEKIYFLNNPVQKKAEDKSAGSTQDELEKQLDVCKNYLGEKHFLSSKERFNTCKKSAEQLKITWSSIDIFNDQECQLLADTIKQNNSILTLLNLTNLQHYDNKNALANNLKIMVGDQDNNNPMIMYSAGYDASSKINLISKVSDIDKYKQFLADTKKYCSINTKEDAIKTVDINAANNLITQLAQELKITDSNCIPRIYLKTGFGLFNATNSLMLRKNGPDLSNVSEDQFKLGEELYIKLLKQMMKPWAATWYFSDKFLNNGTDKVLSVNSIKKFIHDYIPPPSPGPNK